MAYQQTGRQLASAMDRRITQPSDFRSPAPANAYDQGNSSLYRTRSNEVSDDSGFFSADSPNSSPLASYRDFQLYDSDADYVDDGASLFGNQGSHTSSQVAQTPSYSSQSSSANRNRNGTASSQSSSGLVYQSTESSHPSLFGHYREVYPTGPTPYQEWQVQPWRHERVAYQSESLANTSDPNRYDEDIRLTPEPSIPQPRSPRQRKSKSGSSTTHKRRKH
ncbi:hypothetical protein GLAREA_11556 [Glarea lozoyensis ATCC 20868]|uniref:Uncharacterized protein n=1 Tax=Glarea lozoyensis (strain ATCC 20868 / MF5171) TaxID=1116229 RepID=S3CGE1_GLAL2|nr:uncharacterized protein GLAREA_11556 [Glarea lozoyensis ATCC 20868]EPE24975.1 hypothetical protein GLAREA_11556 [Glarea lozoyensis ATCC 20868]